MKPHRSWIAIVIALGAFRVACEDSMLLAQTSSERCAALARAYPELKGRKLVVGISPAPAHYSATDPQDPENTIGIEPDLLKSAASCLGFTFSYATLSFAGLIPALRSGRLNIIAAGMYASDERSSQIDFVEYMKAREASVVRAGDPKHLTSLDLLCGVTAAEVTGTVESAILDRQNEGCRRQAKPEITFLQFASPDRAVSAVAQGRADIFLTDAGVASFLAHMMPSRLTFGFSIPSNFVLGFGVNKQDSRLKQGLLASLQAQFDDGSIERSLVHWGFSRDQLRAPTIKTR